MDFIRQTVTLQISTPADDFEPSGWYWANLLDLDDDMVQLLDASEAELFSIPEDEDDSLPTCRECRYTLRQDAKGTWIDFTDGDVCHGDVQHTPMTN